MAGIEGRLTYRNVSDTLVYMTTTATTEDKLTKTCYYDAKERRYVVICKQGEIIRHHKLPRTIQTDPPAKRAMRTLTTAFHHFD